MFKFTLCYQTLQLSTFYLIFYKYSNAYASAANTMLISLYMIDYFQYSLCVCVIICGIRSVYILLSLDSCKAVILYETEYYFVVDYIRGSKFSTAVTIVTL